MRLFGAFMLLMLFSASAFAVTGTGCAVKKEDAIEYALSDLASQIRVRVQSEFYQYKSSSGAYRATYQFRLTTDIPIMGYKRMSYSQNGLNCEDVTIDKDSIPSYKAELSRLIKDINHLVSSAKEAPKGVSPEALLSQAITAYDNYDQHFAAMIFLGAEAERPAYSRAEIEAELLKHRSVSADVKQIAVNISKQFDNTNYYVHPPKLMDSSAVTPFAAILKHELKGADSPSSAEKHLFCVYDPSTDPFLIGCRLTDNTGRVLESAITAVDKKLCETVECYQSANMKKMEEAFKNKVSAGDGFRTHFYTNVGVSPLLALEDEVVRVYVRTSRQAKLALFAFTPDGGVFVPLKQNLTKANVQHELAAFKVEAPFGNDTLVLFAYEGELKKEFPAKLVIDDLPAIRNMLKATAKAYTEEMIVITTRSAE